MVISLSMWPPRRRPNTTGFRTAPQPFISDSQWKLIKNLFPKPRSSPHGGRPPADARACLEGIIRALDGKNFQIGFPHLQLAGSP